MPTLYTDPAPSVVQASLVPLTQVVALSGGTTTATISGSVTVAGSVSLDASANQIGSVSVSVLPALVASAAQIGSVSVSVLPALVAGAAQIGSVTVSNFPATQIVSGSGLFLVSQLTAASLLMTPVQTTAASLQVSATQSGAPWSDNLTQVSGSTIGLGPTTMASSLPVTMAVDQLWISQLLELNTSILVELRVLNSLVHIGLNVQDDPDNLRHDPTILMN